MSDETGTPQQDSILEAATTIALHCGRSIPEASDYRVVANAYAREIERLRGDLSETRIALANAECREGVAKARLAEAEREQDTLLAMIRHQRDVLRECLPYLNESMAGRRPGRSADDIRAAVKALTTDKSKVSE